MNLTVLENRLADFNRTMYSIADDLRHFRVLVDKELAEKEARKGEGDREREMYEKRELVHNLVVHKGRWIHRMRRVHSSFHGCGCQS